MQYGEFSADGTEYIIHTPNTPRPWLNFLTNGRYAALVSPTGGGFSFVEDSGFDRLTRCHPGDFVVKDEPGRYLYVREASGEYWGLTGAPVPVAYDRWQARHGLGYTEVTTARAGLYSQVTYYVPPHENLEIWLVEIRNDREQPVSLNVLPYVELVMGNFQFDLLERSFADLFNETGQERGVLWATKRFWDVPHPHRRRHDRPVGGNPNRPWDKLAFMASTLEPTAYRTGRDSFLGPRGSLSHPAALEQPELANQLAQGESAAFILQLPLSLEPGETKTFGVLFGTVEHLGGAFDLLEKYRDPERLRAGLTETKNHWKRELHGVHVQTPDSDFDLSVNIWNKFQAHITAAWSRMASGYLGGSSILGFRDTCQDAYGLLPLNPSRAKGRLRELSQHQFREGYTLHNWDPRSDLGPVTGHSDDPLWLVLLGVNYLKETGDWEALEEILPFYDDGSGSLWEHLCLALEHSLGQVRTAGENGSLGLSRMGAGDWNDGLDQVGVQGLGESTFTSMFLVWMLREMAAVAARLGEAERAERYQTAATDLTNRLNEQAWDGHWYIRGRTDAGDIFGSHRNAYGRIYLNPQTWSVLSGVAPPQRARAALESVREHLDTVYGPQMFDPAYLEPDPTIGIVTRFSPGTKENASIFNHPVAWLVIAEAMHGRGDRAYEYLKKTSFITRGADPEVYRAEPYVYAEYVEGKASPRFGQGAFSWATGTAAWMWRAALDYILGVQPDFDGLRLDPCLPPQWGEVKIERRFRGVRFLVTIKNPHGLSKGRLRLQVDGEEWVESVVPVPKGRETCTIVAILERNEPLPG